ncbi:hypothetical protein BEL04_19470 [Mucilaginibacter sp. PPCGB 2223]|uniref:DUF1569 domain-containing protein n=1 Tax=Mucilaginibacter sp. PPCGB 2223 TaxID=1886027 RepID=UPI000825B4E0|nr:DUF1569 domain-containing protein [Mucilaginibacter sp. PPCGB 2223]OCX50905.1 hypothetical protein BEL04_19470 [Mucilaginibacter sp. PPCGB 2223]
MKTILDEATRQQVIDRINHLNASCIAQWGKMNVDQMVKHCRLWDQSILNNTPLPRIPISRLFGKLVLKAVLKDDAPLRRNSPTAPGFKITGDGNIEADKATWITLIQSYPEKAPATFMHPFFGKMSREQISQLAYKHADHHLRQFGC